MLIGLIMTGCGEGEPQEPLRIELNQREIDQILLKAPLPEYDDLDLGSDIDAVYPQPYRPPPFRDDPCHGFPLDVDNHFDMDCDLLYPN